MSLTTYGARIGSVFLTIESIARGTARPKRLILWLDDAEALADPPLELQRLVARGLELRAAEALGSHKKYFPALSEAVRDGVSRLVTADDDVLYPRWWLERLMAASAENPSAVVAYRARQVLLSEREFAPWRDWPLCDSANPSLLHMGIGEAGVGYPQSVVRALLARGTGFLETAPRVDDIWLHSTAVSAGVATRQVAPRPLFPLVVPGSQVLALATSNIDGGGNDAALRAIYTHEDVRRLRAASKGDDRDDQ